MRKKPLTIGIVILIISVLIGVVMAVFSARELPESVTLAVLPDTQLYSQYFPEIFESQTMWIAANAVTEHIDFVIHVGDIVNKSFIPEQWERASHAMSHLDDAGIPYAVVTGNHDIDDDAAAMDRDEYDDSLRLAVEKFPVYFPQSRFSGMPTFGGMSENGYNQYHFVKCGDYEIMVLALDWLPSEETMQWAEQLLAKYKNIPTIIVKHDFICPRHDRNSQEIVPSGESCMSQWEVFSQYNQVFMIINGHYTGADHGTLRNSYGNDVFVCVVDFQGYHKGGNGWMRLMELDFVNNSINARTFSPYVMSIPAEERTAEDLEQLDDPYNQFSFAFDFQSRFKEILD